MRMTLQGYITFDPVREAADGMGWMLSYYQSDDPAPQAVTTENFHRLSNASERSATVTNKALTTNVVTLTTAAAHLFDVGQRVLVSGVGVPFDGEYVIASTPTGTTFTYARTNGNVGSAAATGTVKVPIHAVRSGDVTNKALTTNVVTITLSGTHGFSVGDRVTVAIGDAVFDGIYVLTGVAATTISYAKTNANVTSAAASGTVQTTPSLMGRANVLFSADADIIAFFYAAAQVTVLAANAATVNSTRDASLVGEGLTP